MKEIQETTKVTKCINHCPFYGTLDGHIMACGHPYFKDKEPYVECIITIEHQDGSIPNECPLKHTKVIKTIEI